MPHPPASHADHDPLAIAAYAAGDATGPELDDALALVAACPGCAALHHDLRAIATALPALPAPVRTRDFRLTPEQAASLRPAGWRRLLAPLAGPRFAFAGPLGTGLATLGIAGLLVAGSVGIPLGGAASAPAAAGSPEAAYDASARPATGEEELKAAGMASPPGMASPAEELAPLPAEVFMATEAPGGDVAAGQAPTEDAARLGTEAGPVESDAGVSGASAPGSDVAAVPLLPLASALLLLAGLVLAGLSFAGRLLATRS